MPPGPGQPRCLSKSQKNSDIQGHLPSTGGRCNASIGCNARGLILDLKREVYSQICLQNRKPDHICKWSKPVPNPGPLTHINKRPNNKQYKTPQTYKISIKSVEQYIIVYERTQHHDPDKFLTQPQSQKPLDNPPECHIAYKAGNEKLSLDQAVQNISREIK